MVALVILIVVIVVIVMFGDVGEGFGEGGTTIEKARIKEGPVVGDAFAVVGGEGAGWGSGGAHGGCVVVTVFGRRGAVGW